VSGDAYGERPEMAGNRHRRYIPWAATSAIFYETKEGLFDILIPYFKAGLEDIEYCMPVVYDPFDEPRSEARIEGAFTAPMSLKTSAWPGDGPANYQERPSV
jgi:hypothetical protein